MVVGSDPAVALRSAELLKALPPAVVDDFMALVDVRLLTPQTVIFSEGEPADRMYLVVSGRVKVMRRGDHGRDNILVVAGPGELLGGLSIFEPGLQKTTWPWAPWRSLSWARRPCAAGWSGTTPPPCGS